MDHHGVSRYDDDPKAPRRSTWSMYTPERKRLIIVVLVVVMLVAVTLFITTDSPSAMTAPGQGPDFAFGRCPGLG
jgi:ABC-type uncharacterized transport system permease subunit